MNEVTVRILENKPVAAGIYKMTFALPKRVVGISCGKFVNISVGDGAHLLRRPIAVCEHTEDTVTICYQLKGEGTRLMSGKKAGDTLSCVRPLGTGFWWGAADTRVAFVGGGVGVFPMYSVLKEYEGTGKKFFSYIGFRSKAAVCYAEGFAALSEKAEIVTDDGSFGKKSNAVEAFLGDFENAKPDVVLSCGPTPMLRALKAGLAERGINIPCYVSLEERMGCGIGACLVCVCKKSGKAENARVCKDGPVFEIGEVEL